MPSATPCMIKYAVTCHMARNRIKPTMPPTSKLDARIPQNMLPNMKVPLFTLNVYCVLVLGSQTDGMTPVLSLRVVAVMEGRKRRVMISAHRVATPAATATGTTTIDLSRGYRMFTWDAMLSDIACDTTLEIGDTRLVILMADATSSSGIALPRGVVGLKMGSMVSQSCSGALVKREHAKSPSSSSSKNALSQKLCRKVPNRMQSSRSKPALSRKYSTLRRKRTNISRHPSTALLTIV
mmetsp:Transcript_24789/g.60927  ORF Transcript_24789/g.60927 Transcript_24789/m.60927 type:complete len:238 (+) Transcript_24789:1154-1867(+)